MANVSFTVTVRAASDDLVIAGAQVFVNGSSVGVTDSNGHLTITLDSATSYSLSVKATNYVNFATPGIIADQPSYTVSLESASVASTKSFQLSITPEDAANGAPLVFSNGGTPVTTNYTSGGITVAGLSRISQTITGNIPGYNTIGQTFDLSILDNGVIQLVASTDTGNKQTDQTKFSTDPDTSTLLPVLTPEALPEFVAPNTGQGTYFTMTQARVYIGGLFIDELNGLQCALQDNKIPIYGYASRFYDAIGQGKSLVQGQFTLNFISEGYLITALQAYQDQLTQADTPIDPIKAAQQARLLNLVNQLQNPDPAWTPAMNQAAKTEISNLAATLGPDSLINAQSGISTIRKQQNNSILGLPGGDFPNAVYSDIPFDIVGEFTGGGRTITRRLEDCHLISNETILDHSGTPILDSYGFIARRLR